MLTTVPRVLVAVAVVLVEVEELLAVVVVVLTLVVVGNTKLGWLVVIGAKTLMRPLPPHICVLSPLHGILQSV